MQALSTSIQISRLLPIFHSTRDISPTPTGMPIIAMAMCGNSNFIPVGRNNHAPPHTKSIEAHDKIFMRQSASPSEGGLDCYKALKSCFGYFAFAKRSIIIDEVNDSGDNCH